MNPRTRISTRNRNNQIQVLVAVQHPMEPGNRKDAKTGATVPAHFIKTMSLFLNGQPVAEANLGPGVSKNSVTSITLKEAKPGDRVTATWIDTRNEQETASAVIA